LVRRLDGRDALDAAAGAGASTTTGGAGGAGARCRLLRLHGAAQAVAVGLAADAVGLGVLDGRGVALHADPELDAQVERFLVREPELSTELVYADLLRQLPLRSSLQGRARRRR